MQRKRLSPRDRWDYGKCERGTFYHAKESLAVNNILDLTGVYNFVMSGDNGDVLWGREGDPCPLCSASLVGEGLPDEFNAVWCDQCLDNGILTYKDLCEQMMIMRGQAWYLATRGEETRITVKAIMNMVNRALDAFDGTLERNLREQAAQHIR